MTAPGLTKAQLDAAQEYATASIAALKSPQGIHPGTVVAATARMAGACLFRTFRLALPDTVEPGQAVFSDAANERGPALVEVAGRLLARIGVAVDPSFADQVAEPKHQPTLGFLDTQRLLEPAYAPITARLAFTEEQTAFAVAGATALLIRHCAKALDPSVAFGLAVYGFVEGTKTAPDRPGHTAPAH